MGLKKKILLIRLSSLGDIVLSQAECDSLCTESDVDLLLKKENKIALLSTDLSPQPILYERDASESSWKCMSRYAELIIKNDYDKVVDLHHILKTKWIRFLCFLYVLRNRSALKKNKKMKWITLSKPRLKRIAFCVFKKCCPQSMRPTPYVDLVRDLFIKHKLIHSEKSGDLIGLGDFVSFRKNVKSTSSIQCEQSFLFFGVAPGSAWDSKKWTWESFFQVIKKISVEKKITPILFGTSDDESIKKIINACEQEKILVEHCLDERSEKKLKTKILKCGFMVSNDSFMAHLSESYQVPVVMIFGPTHPDYGFGPRLKESESVTPKIWCNPCSKDGSLCFRTGENRFKCIKEIAPNSVIDHIDRVLQKSKDNV